MAEKPSFRSRQQIRYRYLFSRRHTTQTKSPPKVTPRLTATAGVWSLQRQKSRASVLFTASVLSHRPYTVSVLFFLLVRAERRTTNFSAQNRQRAKKKGQKKRAKIIEQQIRRGLAINDSSGLETKLFFFPFFFSGGGLPKKRKKLRGFFFYLIFWGLFHILFAALQLRWRERQSH